MHTASKHEFSVGDLPDSFPKNVESIAVDTESMGLLPSRDRLCVVQVSTGDGPAFIVQFRNGSGFEAPILRSVLENPKVLKIFHFARADIGMIKHYLDVWAMPCYCTKIASRLARTYTDHHSLKELCNELLGIRLNKYQQCSDWGAFSLSSEQMDYAASDVIYLHRIRTALDIMLKRENRTELANSCFEFLKHRVQLDLLGWGEDFFSHMSS